jgi:hypothetical protein
MLASMTRLIGTSTFIVIASLKFPDSSPCLFSDQAGDERTRQETLPTNSPRGILFSDALAV